MAGGADPVLRLAELPPYGGLDARGGAESNGRSHGSAMATPTYTTMLSIGELEASYPLYCKAMRILIRDGATEEKARRTVCWNRLEVLHHSLPRQYRHPRQLFVVLMRDIRAEGVPGHRAANALV